MPDASVDTQHPETTNDRSGSDRPDGGSSPRGVGILGRVRSRIFDAGFAVWTGLFGLAIPVLWVLGSPGAPTRALTRAWVRGVLGWLRASVGLRHVEYGRENIPSEPCLIVANHQSTWETLAALVLFPNVAIVAKQELLSIPVFGWFLRHSPMIVIDRATGASALRDMIAQSEAALAQGRSILVFPEGSRRAVEDPVVFKRGAELLYTKLGIPVLPMALDSGRFWSPQERHKRKGCVSVSYLPTISPGLSGREFTQRLETLLEQEKGRFSG